jgi:putative tryptophan/tyrosine transport system substrate-binding protein
VLLFFRRKLRREFITLLGGTAAWPLAARAQQGERMRRIGVLLNLRENDPRGKATVTAFVQRLKELGWTEGRNVHLDIRWGGDDTDRYRQYARELVGLFPDFVLGSSSAVVAALQRVSRTVPIVFAAVVDPIGAGLIESMARPGGNTTGFIAFEYAIGAKWLELLKEISPSVTRAAVLRGIPPSPPASASLPPSRRLCQLGSS